LIALRTFFHSCCCLFQQSEYATELLTTKTIEWLKRDNVSGAASVGNASPCVVPSGTNIRMTAAARTMPCDCFHVLPARWCHRAQFGVAATCICRHHIGDEN
jgi:hypothetical protein